jgi:hypothetical protein
VTYGRYNAWQRDEIARRIAWAAVERRYHNVGREVGYCQSPGWRLRRYVASGVVPLNPFPPAAVVSCGAATWFRLKELSRFRQIVAAIYHHTLGHRPANQRRMEVTMQTRSLVLAALGSVFIIGATTQAFADEDGWRRHEWREHREYNDWHERHGGRPGYYPPAYYAPPPVYYPPPPVYYAPPPVYYGPPGISFGFRLH